MKLILFPNEEKYLVALTGISNNNYLGTPKEIKSSSRQNLFTKSETSKKYSPSFSEMEGLMEYKQFPNADARRKEVENLETLLKVSQLKKYKNTKTHNLAVWLAASTIVLIVVITALIHHIKIREINKVYDSSFVIPPAYLTLSTTNLPLNIQWNQSVAAYYQKEYQNAIDGFSQLEEAFFYSEHALFFKGICFMQENQYFQAITAFERIKPSSGIYTKAKWNIGLCHLKLNQVNAARVIFSELTISEEWAKNAKEILLKLESID